MSAQEEKKTVDVAAEEEQKQEEGEDLVTAWDIQAASDKGVDYDKLLEKFGCFPMTPELIERVEKLSEQKAHRFIRRGIFFCQRDLEVVLNSYQKEQPFYLYTGRGPSADALHLGHTVPFIFTKYLQEAFDVPLVIQITDDEKYIYKPEMEMEGKKGTIQMGIENIKDIIAFGFDPAKTFIFSDIEYIQTLYPNVLRVQKHINFNQIKGIFGFNASDIVGKFAFPAVQAVPSFSNSFPHIFGKKTNVPCLIPAAIDQDPYFRMTRDLAHKLKYSKPANIYSTFFPALQGKKSKMSSSIASSAILLTDSAADIKKKVNKYAMSGGGQTVEEHRANGANLDIDVPFQYLQFFLEDDEQLADIEKKYSSGEMLTGEVKQILIKCLQDFVKEFQEKRKKVTNKDVEAFMKVRKIDPFPKRWNKGGNAAAAESKPKKNIDKATLEAYEKTLTDNQYLGGMLPSATDKEVYESFEGADIDAVAYPAVYAWFMLIGKFALKIRDTWKGSKADKKSKDKDAGKKNDKKNDKKKQEKKPEAKKAEAEEDDLDLFGGDAEADAKAAADAKEKNKKKKVKAAPIAKSLIVWDVKPWGPEIDLDAMAAEILKIEQDGLLWKTAYRKEPVAFGVFKLVIGATVEDEKVSTDDLQEKIEALEEMVQSVDIVAFNKV